MAIKKTELYSSLWASCDELRGGMDASQYKDYILTLLFVKYVSDKYAGDPNGLIIVPDGGSFDDMIKLAGDSNIGEKINIIVKRLAEENDLRGVIDIADFNDEDKLGKGKAMVDRLSKLVKVFDSLDLSANRAEGDDLLGDAYEYLMRHFATESGKSKGQFYTPAEVSRILAKVIGINKQTRQDETVYDPTCGSGSLLLKVADESPRGMTLFGQEMDNATAALAKMNMILHGSPTAEIWQDNTLSEPYWKNKDGGLKTFDYAVANPPFSFKAWSSGVSVDKDPFARFEYGTPPEKNGDYAFLLHMIKSLKSKGKGAIILPHGVLFRGNAEAVIRRNLVKQGYIKGIIGLPPNLFYGTGIPACIVVIDKEAANPENDIFMIDGSRGFIKDGNKNRLRSQDLHKIVDVFNRRHELARYSRLVPFAEIEKNDFNLNIPRYVDSSEPEDIHDLTAHMNGGIPNADIDALEDYWSVFPSLRATLFKPNGRDGYSDAQVPANQVRQTVLDHSEFDTFRQIVLKPFENWRAKHLDRLRTIDVGDSPKELIFDLSEDLLARYAEPPLIDKYDVYQLLMNYWSDVMQDDVYILAQDGWKAGSVIRELIPVKDKNGKNTYKEEHDFEFNKVRYKSDLVPPSLVIGRFFAEDQRKLESLQAALDEAIQTLEQFVEDNSGEDGLIEDAKNDKGKVSQKSVKDCLDAAYDQDEIACFKTCLSLIKKEAAAKKAVKDAKDKLDVKTFQKIKALTEDETRAVVIDDKWLTTLQRDIDAEVERVTNRLVDRVRTLEERYADPLPKLSERVEELSARVDDHLKAMGVAW